jgi:hypothetical protein
VGRVCGTYGWQERCIPCFDGKTRGETLFGNLAINGRIILKWVSKKCDGGGHRRDYSGSG